MLVRLEFLLVGLCLYIAKQLVSLVADELVEVEKNAVEAQNFRKTTDHFRGI